MSTRNAFPVCLCLCVVMCVCVYVGGWAGVCVCVCISSLQYFDMIKDQKYGLFKSYFYGYNT